MFWRADVLQKINMFGRSGESVAVLAGFTSMILMLPGGASAARDHPFHMMTVRFPRATNAMAVHIPGYQGEDSATFTPPAGQTLRR